MSKTNSIKDSSAFKQLLKLYEQKQYKKGLKQADKLLEEVGRNGGKVFSYISQKIFVPETMSMKAIFLYLTGQQDEGLTLGKEALNTNLRSDICWHIYGIINRSMRNYAEASKCYKMALAIDPSNLQILRDLALLQIQIRDIEGLVDTRQKLLFNKETVIGNWLALAVALHLKGDYQQWLKLMESVHKVLEQQQPKKYELSDYEAYVREEMGDYQGELEFLESKKQEILDRQGWSIMKAEALIKLGRGIEAQPLVEEFITKNQNNRALHDLLRRAVGGNDELQFYTSLEQRFPQSQSIKYKLLELTQAPEDFKTRFQQYLKPYYRNGKPSLFREIRSLYQQVSEGGQKIKLIEEVLERNHSTLATKSAGGTAETEKIKQSTFYDQPENLETPICALWSFMVLAQHYDRVQRFEDAHKQIDQALKHTPTLVELYLIKAKIFKHQYDFTAAHEWAEKARLMDLADRYLNNKCIKYALRNNLPHEAHQLMRLFLKDGSDDNAFDLQTFWYEISLMETYMRLGQIEWAMRIGKFIERHFSDIYEDQFDFHSYTLRKYTLLAYVKFLRYEDECYNNTYYIRGATMMIRALLKYSEVKARKVQEAEEEKEALKAMNKSEKKKYNKKKEKEAKLKEETQDPYVRKYDLDSKSYLEKLQDPVQEAAGFASRLIDLELQDKTLAAETFKTLIDFYIIRGQPLNVLRALNKFAKKVIPETESEFELYKFKALNYLQEGTALEKLTGPSKELAIKDLAALSNGQPALTIAENYFKLKKDAISQLNYIRLQRFNGKINQTELFAQFETFIANSQSQPQSLTLQELNYAYELLKEEGAKISPQIDEYVHSRVKRFWNKPNTTQPPQEEQKQEN